MTTMVWVLVVAFVLDLALGDPRWLPHPIRGFGWFLARWETPWRALGGWIGVRLAGVFFAATAITAGTAVVTVSIMWAAAVPWVASALAIYWTYSLLAVRDLDVEAGRVIRELRQGRLEAAWRQVAMIVGRDTEQLDESGVLRAVTETVAEGLSDGVVAPLFYFAVGDPAGMAFYKAANTLDSMVGYKNERYGEFGWASARFDDVLNWIPARLTTAIIWLTALLLRLNMTRSIRAVRRDTALQPSPNAGYPEAAFAGALGVQLGGLAFYGGRPIHKPTLGDPMTPLTLDVAGDVRRLLYGTSLFAFLMTGGALWLRT